MYTIEKEHNYEQIIQKSRFICYLFPIRDVDDAISQLNMIRKKHDDATHNCYAYIAGGSGEIAKFSDDNEPSQTAGIVIYDVLKKNNLTNVLAIVTRYYGGIKLGAGGLVRAYSSSTAKALLEVAFIEIIEYIQLNIICAYDYLNAVSKIMNSYTLINKTFATNITLEYKIPKNTQEKVEYELLNTTKNQVIISYKTY